MPPISFNMRSITRRCFCALVLITIVSSRASARSTPVGTAFTYQGSLKQSGSPVNGTHNLVFRLFDVATRGSALATSSHPGVAIANGLFTVSIDFGMSVFTGDARWLEIQVGAVTLVPRQPLTAVPYAMYALAGNPGPPGPQGIPGTTG